MRASIERVIERRCKICRHKQRDEIEIALLDFVPHSEIQRQYGLSRDTVRAHVRRHLPAALEAGFEGREMARVHSLANRVEILHVEACDILTQSRSGTILERVAAMNTTIKTLELLGRLTGKLVGNGVNELFARLGVRDEDQLRQMLQVARANVSMSTEDHILNGAEIVRAALPDKPEMIDEVRRILEPVLKKALPTNTNGHTNGGEH